MRENVVNFQSMIRNQALQRRLSIVAIKERAAA